jgi:Phage integrase, N-terminal SAM-like domain
MQVRNFSPHTQDFYVQQVSLFARHFSKSPGVLGSEEIRSYQGYLRNEKKLAPSSIPIAIAALRFLYRVTLHKERGVEGLISVGVPCGERVCFTIGWSAGAVGAVTTAGDRGGTAGFESLDESASVRPVCPITVCSSWRAGKSWVPGKGADAGLGRSGVEVGNPVHSCHGAMGDKN